MKRLLLGLVLCATLVACSGVPLRSLPRLIQMSGTLLEASPAEVMVALQVDARMVPPAHAVPLLILKLTPREPGGFAPIDKKLPLQVAVASAATLGLDAPPLGRRWLVYSMPASTQAELQRIQATMRQAKANATGGALSLGVEQESLAVAVTDPALAETRWETWLQMKRADGFFEVWSGTPAQLKKSADKSK
ncbi:MAG: hypothetical protein Q7T69_12515 [Rhodoferax sp.]|nr:hypothetical protein [Rhodoferax sp.]